MRALLDVNVLIALLDENHTDHELVVEWLADHIHDGWASCPLTQNGCVRLLSLPRYPNSLRIEEAMDRLRDAVSTPHHLFIADDISLLDNSKVDGRSLLGPGQVTDAYLLALAVAHGAQFVTLDRSVPAGAVRDAIEESQVTL